MHCHCGPNNRAPRWTFTDPCKTEVRPGAWEESASPVWLAAPAMNANLYIIVHVIVPLPNDLVTVVCRELTLKLMRTPLSILLRGFLNYLSLSMHLLPRMNVMLDFIWTLQV